jgi:hypothetical protein
MRKLRRRSVVGVLVAAIAAFASVATAIAAPGNPPGANGTVKIDRQPFDTHPNNQPHVGCNFQVDFYGFDQGPYNAKVTFELHPPSGNRVLLTDTVFVGQDLAGGGTDLDAERTYNLSALLRRGEAHPKQGFHVKVTVEAPGAGGKIAKKSKVFWVQQCKPKCGY